MKILALDVATKTGWACDAGYGEENFAPSPRESRGMRFVKFGGWLNRIFSEVQPELVIYEQPHLRGGPASQALGGMVAILQTKCLEKGIEYSCVHSGELKRYATGKGNAGKPEMIKTAKQRYEVNGDLTDNEADALHIYHWGLKEFGGKR